MGEGYNAADGETKKWLIIFLNITIRNLGIKLVSVTFSQDH